MSEREKHERAKQRKCVLARVCVEIFGQNIKKYSKATRQLVVFTSSFTQTRIHSVYTLKAHQHTHNKITQTQQIIHPSFMRGCTKLWHPFVNWS